jgi:hypothetical protein
MHLFIAKSSTLSCSFATRMGGCWVGSDVVEAANAAWWAALTFYSGDKFNCGALVVAVCANHTLADRLQSVPFHDCVVGPLLN